MKLSARTRIARYRTAMTSSLSLAQTWPVDMASVLPSSPELGSVQSLASGLVQPAGATPSRLNLETSSRSI
jgi:hypothetical protein